MTKKENTWILDILVRYVLSGLCFFIIPVFYFVFKPITIWLVSLILGIFYSVSVQGNVLLFSGNMSVEIIDACIAGSAYFLLLILNLLTREINILKRIGLFLFCFLSLFFLNVVRLLILIPLFLNNSSNFDFAHKLFWFVLSIVFVVLIWILGTLIFRIKKIPVYSDVIKIIEQARYKCKN